MFLHCPRFFYIAPDTTYIAACQAYKVRCMTGIETFPLNGVKVFHNRNVCGWVELHGIANVKKDSRFYGATFAIRSELQIVLIIFCYFTIKRTNRLQQ